MLDIAGSAIKSGAEPPYSKIPAEEIEHGR